MLGESHRARRLSLVVVASTSHGRCRSCLLLMVMTEEYKGPQYENQDGTTNTWNLDLWSGGLIQLTPAFGIETCGAVA